MPKQEQTGSERRQQTRAMIQELLKERQQVWSLYCTVAGLEPFTLDKPLDTLVQEFCQVLVDYISLGHFGIYQRITDGNERRSKVIEKAEEIYPRIARATDTAIQFNDKYKKLSGDAVLSSLSVDLSALGEELAMRIELEDQLIETMVA
ncbi:MAG: sigma D regulator [Methylococcaceae bacterium]|nr:sigma D regulator [Methylococcaceae bacterium]